MSGRGAFNGGNSGRGGSANSGGQGGAATSAGRGGKVKTPRAAKVEAGVGKTAGQQPDASHMGLVTPVKATNQDEDRSSNAGSDVHSSVSQGPDTAKRLAAIEKREREVMLLEQQLQEQVAQFQRFSLSSASAGPSGALSQQQQQQGQQQQQPTVEQAVRVAAVQPPELTYAGAMAGTALEDWLFKLEQLFTQTRRPESAWLERAQTAQLHWDRHMSLWWNGRQEVAAAAGAPIQSWTAFVAALRKQFTPAGDAEAARTELFHMKMRSGETVETYLQRAVLVVARAGAKVESRTAAALTLGGMDQSRFPFTCSNVSRLERDAGDAGMSFAQMREALSREAAVEPKLGARGASSSNGSSSSGSSGSSAKTNSRQLRINALQQQLRALEEADEDDSGSAEEEMESGFSTAPIAASSSTRESRCSKCSKTGHAALDCRSKVELRSCYGCGQAGHLKSKCPKLKQKGQTHASAAGSSKPSPKNE